MSRSHNYPAKSNRVYYHRTSLSSNMIQVQKHSRDNSDNDTPHDLHLSLGSNSRNIWTMTRDPFSLSQIPVSTISLINVVMEKGYLKPLCTDCIVIEKVYCNCSLTSY